MNSYMIGKRLLSVDLNILIEITMKGRRIQVAKEFFDIVKTNPNRFELFLSAHFKKLSPDISNLLNKYGIRKGNFHEYKQYTLKRNFMPNDYHKFASSAGVNIEDVELFIGSFLMNCDYIVTFNRKQCNKLTQIKNTGWNFGIEVPDIIEVNKFIHLMHFLL
ncbi:MAG: hypothetical protein ACE5KT_10660 [Methanosarcinales archaeon]